MYNWPRKIILSGLRERLRQERVQLFMKLMQPREGVSILDLGGEWGEFLAKIRGGLSGRFLIADINEAYRATVRTQGFDFVLLEENKPLPFADKEFDIVISNSVIEHVTLPKKVCMEKVPRAEWVSQSLMRQQQFASEIRRVGKGYFVQTPNKNFPIETHTWLPFVNFLDHNQTVSVARVTDRFWIKQCGYVDWNLLGPREMRWMFPEAELVVERFLGLPKSIIAYRK
jgi:2-polyprenyl-3-methyl-5-hydroxy-6-metoxy-1,4-benzoquinol methylase